MKNDISKKNNAGSKLENELSVLKQEYQKPEMSKEQLEKLRKKMEETKSMEKSRDQKRRMARFAAAAAVFVGAFVLLPNISEPIAHAMGRIPILGQLVEVVTFRNYVYETDRNMANIEAPEIEVEGAAGNSEAQKTLEHTAEEINAEIQKITNDLVEEFEANLAYEEGYQDVIVQSEVLATTADYFTLKLICYQGAGSGYEWNYYYTIDLHTGERLKLKDIFLENADYITPISENIKEQMQAQMAADENVSYWLESDIEEWNFKAITDETSFYLNESNHVVIGFDEGEVAPMYMGTVEFEIPTEVLADIRK